VTTVVLRACVCVSVCLQCSACAMHCRCCWRWR
jgi:hypothetical protein